MVNIKPIALHTPTPEIAKTVETFKTSFERTFSDCSRFIGDVDDTDDLRNLKSELWRDFAGHYVDVLTSMHGWKSCAESAREELAKLKKVVIHNFTLDTPEIVKAVNCHEELLAACEGMAKYWEWSIGDPDFEEYRRLKSAINKAKQ